MILHKDIRVLFETILKRNSALAFALSVRKSCSQKFPGMMSRRQ